MTDTASTTRNMASIAEQYAVSVLSQMPPDFLYHNQAHTRFVANAAHEIGKNTGFTEQELEYLMVAAWLHDVGYAQSRSNHEEHSAQMAAQLLAENHWPAERIQVVLSAIAATKMPQSPQTDIEKALCDADLSHLAHDDFFVFSEDLRAELNAFGYDLGERKWLKTTLTLFGNHQYFTPYAQAVYESPKKANLKKVEARVTELKKEKEEKKATANTFVQHAEANATTTEPATTVTEGKPKKDKKDKRPDRGIETMFRTTSANHIRLSEMADNKANIMISVNTIVMSLIVSILLPKLDKYPHFIGPVTLLIAVCLVSVVYAIKVTRPQITKGRFTREDIEKRTVNLLFFGNFHEMELSDYEKGMNEMMNDADFLYASMTRDIYFLGKVLGRKYRMLRTAYTIFMVGFVLSVLLFGIAAFLSL